MKQKQISLLGLTMVITFSGKEKKQMYYCPMNDFECPYWESGNYCNLEDAPEQCDAFYEEDPEDYEIKENELL